MLPHEFNFIVCDSSALATSGFFAASDYYGSSASMTDIRVNSLAIPLMPSLVHMSTCLVLMRGLDSFPTGFVPLFPSAASRTSSLRSQSSIFAW